MGMRILVMGTGGVGGYFGARLAAAGHKVGFVARGRHIEAIKAYGLKVLSPLGDLTLPSVQVSENPADFDAPDLVMLGTKLWDISGAIEQLRGALAPHTAVVSFQNGVMKDELLARELGEERVIGGVSYISAHIQEPGVIRHSSPMQKLVFGELDGARSERVERFREACASAGIDAEVSPDIRRAIWEKFVFLVGFSGSTTLARSTIGPIRENERTRAFLLDVMDEVVRVAVAEGVPLPTDFARDRLAFVDTLPGTASSSMHGDLERGNRLEVEWLSGDVARRGKALGVQTPRNRVIAEVLSLHAAGRA